MAAPAGRQTKLQRLVNFMRMRRHGEGEMCYLRLPRYRWERCSGSMIGRCRRREGRCSVYTARPCPHSRRCREDSSSRSSSTTNVCHLSTVHTSWPQPAVQTATPSLQLSPPALQVHYNHVYTTQLLVITDTDNYLWYAVLFKQTRSALSTKSSKFNY